MISRYKVFLNDVELGSLDECVCVTDITYPTVSPKYSVVKLAGRDGTYSGKKAVESNIVSVSFMVRAYDTQYRQAVVQEIAKWCAKGGWLKTSDRPGQKMYVKCSKYPAVTSVLQWTGIVSTEFIAYDYPFWVDEFPKEVELENDETKTVFVPGVLCTDIEAVVTPSEALTGLTINCGDTSLELDGIEITAEQPIEIRYTDEHHFLEIVSGGSSLLAYRTPESDDDLKMEPGSGTVSFEADGAAVCKLRIRGVYV